MSGVAHATANASTSANQPPSDAPSPCLPVDDLDQAARDFTARNRIWILALRPSDLARHWTSLSSRHAVVCTTTVVDQTAVNLTLFVEARPTALPAGPDTQLNRC